MSRVVEVTGLMVGFVGSVWSKTDGSISGKLLACRRVRPSSARVQLRREEEDEYDPLLADIASLKKRRALEKEKESQMQELQESLSRWVDGGCSVTGCLV